ncbi:MAG: TIGR03618 family F420-dependent PPOX class oxidoreductase [Acidobacteriota bacterium]|nr:TIGR03618 family F420-dependent PPOX class oxidoreductase [Blastocatellia bacterium]MDW8240328.1 TIGR03618 family F420-dependent PPOX class oxidoreductase [Acidobacteriota bacterium]
MSVRKQIRMTDDEVAAFLQGRHTMSVATIGKDGQPHLVAMWYGFLDGAPAFWTYKKSQKIRNLQRDNRITCLVEEGETYEQLRGAMLIGRGTILEDQAIVIKVGESVFERYYGQSGEAVRPVIEQMGRKRVVVRIDVERVISWDHRKLAALSAAD